MLILRADERLGLPIRAPEIILRAACTIAGFIRFEDVHAPHVAEANQDRPLSRRPDRDRIGGVVVTPAEAQAEIRSIAEELLAVDDRLRQVWQAVLRAPDEDAMFEGRIPWDLPTELRTTVECVLEGQTRPAIESVERATQRSEEDLRREFHPGTQAVHLVQQDPSI